MKRQFLLVLKLLKYHQFLNTELVFFCENIFLIFRKPIKKITGQIPLSIVVAAGVTSAGVNKYTISKYMYMCINDFGNLVLCCLFGVFFMSGRPCNTRLAGVIHIGKRDRKFTDLWAFLTLVFVS